MDSTEEILNLLRDNARISVEDISAMTKKSSRLSSSLKMTALL